MFFGPMTLVLQRNTIKSTQRVSFAGNYYPGPSYGGFNFSSPSWTPFNGLSAVDYFTIPYLSYGSSPQLAATHNGDFSQIPFMIWRAINKYSGVVGCTVDSSYFVDYYIPVDFSSLDFSSSFRLDFSDFFNFDSGINLLSSYFIMVDDGTKLPFTSNSKYDIGSDVISQSVSFSSIEVSLVDNIISFSDGFTGEYANNNLSSFCYPYSDVLSYPLNVVGSGSVVVEAGSLTFEPKYIRIHIPSPGDIDFFSGVDDVVVSSTTYSSNRFVAPTVQTSTLRGVITYQQILSDNEKLIYKLNRIIELLEQNAGCQCKDLLFNISQKLDDLGNMFNSFFKNANNFFSSVLSRLDGITALLGDAGGGDSGSLADESEALQNSTDQLQDAKPPASAPLGLFGVFGQIASFIGGGFSYVFDWFGWSDNSADFVYNSLGLVYSVEPDTSPVPIG